MKEYIVTLKAGVDYDAFYDAMVQSSTEALVPHRQVEIANERPLSQRNTHYFLTDHEASVLQQDPRVLAVEIPPDQRDDIKITPFNIQSSNFNKTTSDSGPFVNWGLLRCGFVNNATYGSTGFPTVCAYPYHLDGTGVDVVVHDSGLQIDHPEFTDANNASRVQQINWYTASGIAGTQSVNFYRDYHGHGTHVCGTMCGKTYGWAKNARVYALKVNGLEGSGDSGTGISITDCFDVVKGWHLNKPVDPVTGKKRPTVVNMSWGYGTSYSSLTGGNYRGTNWAGVSPNTSYGMVNYTGRVSVRVASVDTDVDELIQAGVTVCVAAGNDYFKIDVPGGADYDNYFGRSGGAQVFYHRGSSPYSLSAVIVGCVDSIATPTEYKKTFSNGGPGVDVFAPGTDIMSSTSTTNELGGVTYFLNSSYKQVNISGTSMASPQVAGMCALFYQLNPDALPHQVKMFTIKTAVSGALYDTAGSSTNYTGTNTLLGGYNRYLLNPYANNTGMIYKNIYQGIPVQQQNILNTARDEVVVFYNQNSTDSIDVANYYKTKRPNFSKVNTVGLDIPYQIYPQRRAVDTSVQIALSASVLFGAGRNLEGQLGLDDSGVAFSVSTFTAVTGNWSNVVCAKGGSYTMALSAGTNKWFGTGTNTSGQLGIGTITDSSTFVPLTGNWSSMACGAGHTMALSAGTNKWFGTGSNFDGELGIGNNIYPYSSFVALTGNWSSMACGASHTMALSAGTNALFATGNNFYGQLGLGTSGAGTYKNSFTAVAGNWSKVICGHNHTMALSAGTNKWFGAGDNSVGQLGIGNTFSTGTFQTALTGYWSQVSAGQSHTMALSAGTNALYATGRNANGALGLGDNISKTSFTACTGVWSDVVCVSNSTMALSAGTNKWFGTGLNTNGQLGIGNTSSTNAFVALTGNWSSMACGASHTMALSTVIVGFALSAVATIISEAGADIGVPYEGCRKYDLIHNINFNASVIAPMQAYLASNIKTKYIVCSLDMPLHIIDQTSTAVPYLTTLASVSGVPYHISKNTGIFPFYLAGEYREDVLAYIDKLSRASADGIKLYTNRLSAYAEDSNLYGISYFALWGIPDTIFRSVSAMYLYRTGSNLQGQGIGSPTTYHRPTTGMFCDYNNAWPHDTGNLPTSSMCYFGSWGFNGRRFINPNGPYLYNISGEGEVAGLSAISYYTDPASRGKLTFNNPQKIDNWSFVYTVESFNASPGGGSYGPYTALVPSWGTFPTSYTGVKTFSAFKTSWQYAAGMRPIRHSHFTQYFSKSAFGGSNYENTAVNWVGHLYEPYYPGAVNNTHITAWLSGGISYDCVTNNFANKLPALAIGDPLVFVKTPLFNTIIF